MQERPRGIKHFLSWVSYPIVILTCVVVALMGTAAEWSRWQIFFFPITISWAAVSFVEWLIPYTASWKPTWAENYRSDLGIFFANNLLLGAPALVLYITAYISGIAAQYPIYALWPNHYPMWLQLILFLLAFEFVHYWYHRVAHEVFFVWRFHSVHHNPHRLYWLNATRFHYVDILMLPLLGNLPCVLMGGSQEVIVLGAVVSVCHGFWQHCNAKVHYGPLNYVVSSSELHRWHHSQEVKIANHNYGSNLIVWDLLFGTWYLPDEKKFVAENIGVKEMQPAGILAQMIMPIKMK
ncbi:MAG: hypothetical protein K940chlam7_00198 [Chlamydiae bacterium]|nr:hypothetical protein [Chlamydiota bacterium]